MAKRTGQVQDTYGSGKNAATIYTYEERGGTWYAVEGSRNVNFTLEEIKDGVNIEELSDTNTFTSPIDIDSEEALETAIEDDASIPGSDSVEEDETQDPFENYDESEYDTEAMRTDAANGNFSPDDAEDYRHTEIVRASIINGQFGQARQQCARYGLSYEQQLAAKGRNVTAEDE